MAEGFYFDSSVGGRGSSHLQGGGRSRAARTGFCAEKFEARRKAPRPHFSARRTNPPNAARLALHVLLLELLCHESVSREPRIHRLGAELPQRDWLRPGVSRSPGTRGARRNGIPGRG